MQCTIFYTYRGQDASVIALGTLLLKRIIVAFGNLSWSGWNYHVGRVSTSDSAIARKKQMQSQCSKRESMPTWVRLRYPLRSGIIKVFVTDARHEERKRHASSPQCHGVEDRRLLVRCPAQESKWLGKEEGSRHGCGRLRIGRVEEVERSEDELQDTQAHSILTRDRAMLSRAL